MIIKLEHPEKLIEFLKSKPLILYGMGDTGKRIAEWCDKHGIRYLISDQRAEEMIEKGVPGVVPPQNIAHEYKDANVVISSIVYENEITEDLMRLGVDRKRIFPPFLFMPDKVVWKDIEDEELANWNLMSKRFQMIEEWGWIPDRVKSVADYGAGHKFIKDFLPEQTIYYPIDFIDRGDNTIVCDFNKGEFPEIFSEVSVCTGVLMYIEPAEELVGHICGHTEHRIIFSFVTLEGMPDLDIRRRSGMCQDYTEQQIIDMFIEHGFKLEDKKYDTAGNSTMTLFLFER